MKYNFKISTKTPTEDLKDLIVRALADPSVSVSVAYLRVKDSAGAVLGEVSVSPSDWSNHAITKTVTITNAGTAAYFSLDASDGTELFTYTLPEPISLNVNDTVQINWSISIQLGTNMLAVSRILDFIEGRITNIKIDKIKFYSGTTELASTTAESVQANTTENTVTVTGSITPSSNIDYDRIILTDANDNEIFTIAASGTLTANITYNITITITLT